MRESERREPIRLLWVDDNRDLLEMYEHLVPVGLTGFENVGFLSTLDNLDEEIARRRPTIVVLDYSIPGGNSLETMRECSSKFPDVRFVILSAYDHSFIIDKALAAGAAAYQVKNGDLEALMECLRKVAEATDI